MHAARLEPQRSRRRRAIDTTASRTWKVHLDDGKAPHVSGEPFRPFVLVDPYAHAPTASAGAGALRARQPKGQPNYESPPARRDLGHSPLSALKQMPAVPAMPRLDQRCHIRILNGFCPDRMHQSIAFGVAVAREIEIISFRSVGTSARASEGRDDLAEDGTAPGRIISLGCRHLRIWYHSSPFLSTPRMPIWPTCVAAAFMHRKCSHRFHRCHAGSRDRRIRC